MPKDIQPTGIENLDQILHGGFPQKATILLAGNSGSGKTILAMQWLFAGYQQYQEPGIYISLTEPITKAISNVENFSFVKKEDIGPLKVYFTDLRGILQGIGIPETQELNREDIDKILQAIRHLVEQSGARRVVLDSITAIAFRLKEKDFIRDFIYRLGMYLAQIDATVIITSEVRDGKGVSAFGVEEFISDGIIKLNYDKKKGELIRTLEIIKMRGSDYDTHPSPFRIIDKGIKIFLHLSRQLAYEISSQRISTGIAQLDKMLLGGLYKGSASLFTGSAGIGKTNFSLHFLMEGLQHDEKCLFVSFEEAASQLQRNASSFGWNLDFFQKKGLLSLITSYPEERYLDEHLNYIIDIIEKNHPVSRIVIDGISGLMNITDEEGFRIFVSRMASSFKEFQITSYLTAAGGGIFGDLEKSGYHLSTITDNIINLNFVEIQSTLRHAIAVIKTRGTGHDKELKEFIFTDKGVNIISGFSGYEGLLTGQSRKISASIEEQVRQLLIETLGPMGNNVFNEQKEDGLSSQDLEKTINKLAKERIISSADQQKLLIKIESIFGQK